MAIPSEAVLYPAVCRWLQTFLHGRFPRATVAVYDTHAVFLNHFIAQHGLDRLFPTAIWQAYEIKVDLTALVSTAQQTALVFVECKRTRLSLRDLAQLLGYARVARPQLALLLSPAGLSDALQSLLATYGRLDLLEYDWPPHQAPRRLIIGRWQVSSASPDRSALWPPGSL